MPADFIPDNDFIPDAVAPAAPPIDPRIPASQASPTSQATADFIPDSQFQSDEEKYGTPMEMAKTFGEGMVKGVPFLGGAVLKGLQKLGLESSDEVIQTREDVNPGLSLTGQAVTTGLGLFLAPEARVVEGAAAALKAAQAGGKAVEIAEAAAALAKAKSVLTAADAINPISAISKVGAQVGSQLAERIVTKEAATVAGRVLQKAPVAFASAGLEGAIFSGGTVVNDLTLGHPDLTGQQILAEVGGGALIGGGLGILGMGVSEGAKALKNRFLSKGAEEVALGQSIGSKAQAVEDFEKPVWYHGTSGEFKDFGNKPTFFTPDAEAASNYASRTGEGAPNVRPVKMRPGKSINLTDAIENAADETGNFDPESVIQQMMPELKKAGVRYVEFDHPPGIFGESKGYKTKVSLFPEEDVIGAFQGQAGKAPSSMDDMRRMVEEASAIAPLENMPQRAALDEGEKFLADLKFKVHPLQAESLENKAVRREYLAELEMGKSADAKTMSAYEGHQKRELKDVLGKSITGIAPEGTQVTDDAVKGGNRVVEAFTTNYNAEKKALAPDFERFDKAALSRVELPDQIVSKIEEAIPGVSQYMQYVDDKLVLPKYDATMGFSKKVYGAVRDLVDAANREDLTFGKLRNVRESIRTNYLDSIPKPKDQMQIDRIRKGMMDLLQEHVEKTEPDLAVREVFKKYAVNEQNRAIIESIFGGKIGDRVTFGKQIKPERVLDNLFRDTVTVKAAKAILGSDFDVALADYMSKHVGEFTDATKNGFSSNKFGSFLRNKDASLAEAFAEKPQVLKRIEAATTRMQILPDAPSANPSGSGFVVLDAAHKIGLLGKAASYVYNPKSALTDAAHWAAGKFGASMDANRATILKNEILAGKTRAQAEEALKNKLSKWGILGQLAEQADKAAAKIESGARSVFREAAVPAKAGAAISKALTREEVQENREKDIKEFEKKSAKIMALANDPDILLRKLDENTKDLSEHAPNVTASMQKTSAAVVSYLAQKLPKPVDIKPLSAPWKPSATEISLFNHYYSVLEKPHSVFEMIKTGTLTPVAVDAISKVYPDYYRAVNRALMDQITSQKDRIPYRTRLMLSMFSQSDLDPSTTPRSMAMNQINTQGPSGKSDNQQAAKMQGAVKPTQKGLAGLSKISEAATSPQKAVITRK